VTLTGKQKRFLRGLGHHLKPVVFVGQHGITDGVIKKVDEELENHELIKIKLGQNSDDGTADVVEDLAELNAHHVQSIGRVVLMYRPREKDPEIELP